MGYIFGIDAGHEGVGNGLDPGAIGNGYYEANITLAVALALKEKLLRYKDVEVVMPRETHKSNSLSAKTTFFNKYNCNFVLSIHVNAGGGTGAEMYVYKAGTPCSIIAAPILNAYISKTGLRNRGLKEGNLHMVRETKDPAGLIELFFIDTKADTDKMAKAIDTMAQGLLEGYIKAFNLSPKNTTSSTPKPITGGVYRVIAGSYAERSNADRQSQLLKGKDVENFLAYYNDLKVYRVITGSYKDKSNAEKQVQNLKLKGIETFIAYYDK